MMDARPYDADESVAAAAAAAAAASEEAVLQWLLYGAGLVREFEESPDVLPSIRLLPPVQRIAVEADPNLTLLPSLRELQASEREQRAAASRNATASDVFDELPSEAHAIWADEALVEIPLRGEGSGPSMQVTPSSLSFGEVKVGCEDSRSISIRNEGSADLVLSSLSFNTSDTQLSLSGFIVKTGDGAGGQLATTPPRKEMEQAAR